MFKGGVSYKQLLAFCRKYDLTSAEGFHGFKIGRRGFLYRRANCSTIYKDDGEWPRWDWKNLLGPKAHRNLYQYVFLHGPSHGDRERFFLFTRGEFEVYVRKYSRIESRLNIAAVPSDHYREHTEWVFNHEVDWRKKLHKLFA